jgi:hypothetical protein
MYDENREGEDRYFMRIHTQKARRTERQTDSMGREKGTCCEFVERALDKLASIASNQSHVMQMRQEIHNKDPHPS